MTKIIMNNSTKEYFNSKGLSVSKDFYEAANKKNLVSYDEAAERAEANGRKTVMAKDL